MRLSLVLVSTGLLTAACGDGSSGTALDAAPPPDAAPALDAAPDATPALDAAPDAAIVPPTIATVDPPRVPTTGGTAITLTGTGFAAGATVTIDGQPAPVTAATATSLTVTAPAAPGHAGSVALVVTNPDSGAATAEFAYYFGTIGFTLTATLPTGVEPRGILALDLDGDGDLDLATVHRNQAVAPGRIAINLGDGVGGFAPSAPYPVSRSTTSLAVGDYDRDGDLDLATVGADGVDFLWATGAGGFATWTSADVWPASSLLRVAGGDLDGDAHPDLALGYRNAGRGIGGLLVGAAGALTPTPVSATTADVLAITLADLDGDAHPDAIAAAAGALIVARDNGDGTFGAPVSYPAGSPGYAQQLATADLDGDGDLDVVAAMFNSVGLSIYANQGTGALAAPLTLTTAGNFCGGVAAVDVDRDGLPDLICAKLGGGLELRRNLGALQFAAALAIPAGIALREIAAGDFDHDGRTDLAVQDDTAGAVLILRGTSE